METKHKGPMDPIAIVELATDINRVAASAVQTSTAHLQARIDRLEGEKRELVEGMKEAVREMQNDAILCRNDWRTGMFCGLEDRQITDRYNAADYGVEHTLEKVQERIIGPIEALIKKAEGKE